MAKAKAKKAPKKRACAVRKTVRKTPRKTVQKKVAAKKKPTPAAPAERAAPKARPLTKSEIQEFRTLLQNLRDRVVDEISFLAGDNLNRSQREATGDLSSYSFHMADHGTDNFDREFALNLVSSEQDVLYEIDEALQRLDRGEYGVCEGCNQPIEKARLRAIPFARLCVRCKSEQEKRQTKYRPFGPTMQQMSES